MKTPLAWRNLMHSKGRVLLAVAGIGFAIMLMFIQLGFYGSIVTGATLVFDHLDFDVVIVSSQYDYLPRSRSFPRERLYQARSLPGVERVAPFYVARNIWKNPESRARRSVLVMGFDPNEPVFLVPDIQQRIEQLRSRDTLLVDSQTRPSYGKREPGMTTQIGNRDLQILGEYRLGTAFVELGMVVMSDLNFVRSFPGGSINDVSIGLIRVTPGSDLKSVTSQLATALPADVKVYTRKEFSEHEQHHWVTKTSTGFIFGSGVIVAFVVGMVILYQTLSTQITKHLPEYATLKAMGYSPGYLSSVVLQQSGLMAVFGFIPGCLVATGLYHYVRKATFLPIEMTATRVVVVLILALLMSGVSGWLSMRKVTMADPAELF